MIAGRFFLLAVSLKYLKVSKIYLYYQMLFLMIGFSVPQDYGVIRTSIAAGWCYLSFIILAFDFWPGLIAVCISFCYIDIVTKHFIFEE